MIHDEKDHSGTPLVQDVPMFQWLVLSAKETGQTIDYYFDELVNYLRPSFLK